MTVRRECSLQCALGWLWDGSARLLCVLHSGSMEGVCCSEVWLRSSGACDLVLY